MSKWTSANIPRQDGKIAVITGSNSGLGFVAARELARVGARVVIACRDLDKGKQARARILEQAPGADVRVDRLDLADLGSVRSFADAQTDGVDILINNAGVMALPRRLTADGFEMQLGTNHLGHFALTGLLLPKLRTGARVVTMSSGLHRRGRMNWDDLQGERQYGRWPAYCQSKLANLLFMLELHRRLSAAGSSIRSVGAHPGYAATNLQSGAARAGGGGLEGLARYLEGRLMAASNALLAQSEDMGALPELYAATVPDLPGGSYMGPDGLGEGRGHPTLARVSRLARDAATAKQLWDVSEALTGVQYAF